jgi:hypothetical protein
MAMSVNGNSLHSTPEWARVIVERSMTDSKMRGPLAELPTKIVGRRTWRAGLAASAALLDLASDLRGDKPFVPKGVHRFRSFEESDAWLLRMLTRPSKPARRG